MLRSDGRIGRYEVRRRVATGGMGTLYLAHDPVLERTVALKLFHGDLTRSDARDRFVGEARAAAALNHPNIVTIYDYGEYESQPYLVMEYIEGETLADIIRRRPAVPPVAAVRWMEDVCAAVAYAHERGIIHRDVKPANLMVDAYGRIKVLDFGIARMRGTLTSRSTAVIGTPGYVAPEQLRGGTVDHRSDLFSIGVVAYELFSYAEPFGAETLEEITHRTLHEDPAPLESVRPSIDPELAAIVMRALEKSTSDRVQTAEALRDAFGGVRRRLEAAEPETMVAVYLPTAAPESAPPDDGPRASGPRASGPAGADEAHPHRRTTREALARQRQTQVQGWVDLAREHLAAGEIAEARDACGQALTLEPTHAEAVALLRSMGDAAEATILRMPAPQAPLEHPAPTVLVPAPARAAARPDDRLEQEPLPAVSSQRPSDAPAADRVPRAAADRARPGANVRSSRAARTKWIALGAAAAVVVALAGAAMWFMRGAPLGEPALVVIDARPWAMVRSVEAGDGAREPLPADASTPLTLMLAPGTYRVSLVGPPPAAEARVMSIRVAPDAPTHVFIERFASITADEYFDALRVPSAAADQKGESAP